MIGGETFACCHTWSVSHILISGSWRALQTTTRWFRPFLGSTWKLRLKIYIYLLTPLTRYCQNTWTSIYWKFSSQKQHGPFVFGTSNHQLVHTTFNQSCWNEVCCVVFPLAFLFLSWCMRFSQIGLIYLNPKLFRLWPQTSLGFGRCQVPSNWGCWRLARFRSWSCRPRL